MSRRFALGLLVGLCLWGSPLYAAAEEDRLSDAKGLENFVDEFFESQMNRLHIPGLVLTVVKDGKPILTKGFGWADMESGKRVVAEKTVFRVGSVSKLFTAAALLQLVERGSIDLNADVSTYLNPVDIDDNFREPVTAAHLLTHTAGFDDRYIGIATRHQADRSPLPEYISARLPPRIRPPGELIAYSNHGYALAGLLVEEISGVPFETYVDEHLFRPLRMTRTGFELPARLEVDLAVGYRYLEDEFLSKTEAFRDLGFFFRTLKTKCSDAILRITRVYRAVRMAFMSASRTANELLPTPEGFVATRAISSYYRNETWVFSSPPTGSRRSYTRSSAGGSWIAISLLRVLR